jgi:ACS family hexuronate transporter-like MFS transporter
MNAKQRRWLILALLFAATTINYIDRQTLSVLVPVLHEKLHLSDVSYANVVTAFLIPYTIMYSLGGRIMDYLGTRVGIALSLLWWSIATMLTGLSQGAFSLGAFRALLAVGEPCVYPGGIKACAEWFSSRQRAIATGIFSSGSAIGAVLAPPLVVWCNFHFGWRYAFVIPGLLGLCWLPLWLMVNRPKERPAELTTESEIIPEKTKWRDLLRQRVVWSLVLPRLLSDPVWYFYLFWLPDYLERFRHFSLRDLALYGWIPFLFADLGSIVGGAVSDKLIRRKWAPAKARMALLLGVGCLSPIGALAGWVPSIGVVFGILCMVAFLTQCWSTNIATLAADLMPSNVVGATTGMMGTAGSLGAAMFAQVLGVLISAAGYPVAFAVAACLHPLALVVLVGLAGRKRLRGNLSVSI